MVGVRIRPVSPEALVELLADRIAATAPDRWVRVGVDGPPAAGADSLARALIDPLRTRGRAARQVSTTDFLRPASVRLETGRYDPDAFYDGWLDVAGLRREVLDPLRPDGSGRILPTLWDSAVDRATRADYVILPPGGVLLVSGPLLLGGELVFDVTVHLALTAAALARRTDPAQQWTLPAYARYDAEVDPRSIADVVVRLDDPRRPAVEDRSVDDQPIED